MTSLPSYSYMNLNSLKRARVKDFFFFFFSTAKLCEGKFLRGNKANGFKINEKLDKYIDKAVMEMKPNEATANSGICQQSLFDDSTYDVGHVWTRCIIECWTQLAMR